MSLRRLGQSEARHPMAWSCCAWANTCTRARAEKTERPISIPVIRAKARSLFPAGLSFLEKLEPAPLEIATPISFVDLHAALRYALFHIGTARIGTVLFPQFESSHQNTLFVCAVARLKKSLCEVRELLEKAFIATVHCLDHRRQKAGELARRAHSSPSGRLPLFAARLAKIRFAQAICTWMNDGARLG